MSATAVSPRMISVFESFTRVELFEKLAEPVISTGSLLKGSARMILE